MRTAAVKTAAFVAAAAAQGERAAGGVGDAEMTEMLAAGMEAAQKVPWARHAQALLLSAVGPLRRSQRPRTGRRLDAGIACPELAHPKKA